MGVRAAAAHPLPVSIGVLLGAWLLLVQVGALGARDHAGDTPLYASYGQQVVAGRVPYADFRLEYPAGTLPAVVLPALGRPDQREYLRRFHWLMLACAISILVAADSILRATADSARARFASLLCIALLPLFLGPVILSRLDLWPTAFMAAALAALVRRRSALGGALLGIAASAKFFPVVIAPVALLFLWQQRSRGAAMRAAAAFVVAFGAVLLPFVALSFSGGIYPVAYEWHRPLEVETTAAAGLIALHHLFGLRLGDEAGYGSSNLGGTSGGLAEAASTVVMVAALLWVWWRCLCQRLTTASFLTGATASVAALLAFGKVFSLQYLIWLLPLIPLVDSRIRLRAVVLLCTAYGLTWEWFPARRGVPLLVGMSSPQSWFLLARDLVVVALFLLLVTSLGRGTVALTAAEPQTVS